MSKKIIELNNYSMFSTLGLEAYGVDRNTFNNVMDRYPKIITIDLELPLLHLREYTDNPHKVLNELINKYMVYNFNDDDVKYCVEEIDGNNYVRHHVKLSWVVNNLNPINYDKLANIVKQNFAEEACIAISYMNTKFGEHKIPYFENIFPYKHVVIDETSSHAMFVKMSFEELFKRISNHAISQP